MKKYRKEEVKKEEEMEVKVVEGMLPTADTTGDDSELNHSHVTIKE